MRFVYEGEYREFRGYVFAHGKPVTIRDRGTLEAIAKDPTFKEYHEEAKGPETAEEVLKYTCEKCGKFVKQGIYMHRKWCKG